MVEALAPARAHAALKSLGREDRARAVAGTMRTTAALRRVTGAIVVVDDVCTTGATIGEAVRALGGTPVAAVVVAVTPAGRRTARQLG
jgi:predicted amidophosphoribosyltransferase